MLVQTKLFSPPPTTPEAEMNQKMMKYMMIFMAFMFYKVPSGLGLYFITSSLWQIGERLLLPKVTAKSAIVNPDDLDENGRGPGGTNGDGTAPKGWFSRRIEKLLEDAAKDQTIRNASTNDDRARAPGRDNGASRERPRNRPRPGKRR
jgi:YidC/Oxa1 family membrane protein insertase